ncbi:MAG: 4-hydroxy-tetrahydrodipicolinate reductase [Clostridia bacterium]|nr:4-hydroxy-tetrahydrodipicolinate reductase [Clostridia bacterium]
MTKVILSGALGRMGQAITRLASNDSEIEIVCGFDIAENKDISYPVFCDYSKCDIDADVIIDFSNPSNFSNVLNYAKEKKLGLVMCTTGLTPEQRAELSAAASEIPVFFSANMSLGINLLIDLAKKAAALLGENFDIEIIEKHHNQKLDSPSGTALAIADALNEAADNSYEYVYDRHAVRKKRDKKEIGLHAVRGGTIVGDHDVIFAGADEVVTISHHAASRDVFANGAIKAAHFLCGKPAGFYSMSDLVNSI